MSNESELIKKLSAIVAKQQKIITKLAQMVPAPAGTPDLKNGVQASIIDFLYGQGHKMIPGKAYPQVQYAKVQPSSQPGTQGSILTVGLSVPPTIRQKWDSSKDSLSRLLTDKLSTPQQKFSSVIWRDE